MRNMLKKHASKKLGRAHSKSDWRRKDGMFVLSVVFTRTKDFLIKLFLCFDLLSALLLRKSISLKLFFLKHAHH